MAKVTKYSIDLSPEDLKLIAKLRKQMETEQGPVKMAAVIRAALRKAAA